MKKENSALMISHARTYFILKQVDILPPNDTKKTAREFSAGALLGGLTVLPIVAKAILFVTMGESHVY